MALQQRHLLFGEETKNPPKGDDDLSIELNFDNDGVTQAISTTSFEWIDDEAQKLYDYLNEGLTGGLGIFECPDHEIEFTDGDISFNLKFLVNLTNATFGENVVSADSIPEASIDWLKDVAEGVSFERLESEGKITKADYIMMPYILASVPNYRDAFLTILTFAVVQIEARNVTERIKGQLLASGNPISGLGAIIDLIFTIIYLVALLITLVELILDFFSLIIQKVKYLPCMRVNRLLEIGARELGLSYESPVLQSAPLDRLTIMPPPQNLPDSIEDSKIKGFLSPNAVTLQGYYQGTFGQFIREISRVFFLRLQIEGKTMRLLTADFVPSGASFTLPDLDQVAFRPNGDELVRNVNLSFPVDPSDGTTVDNYTGNDVNIAFEPVTINDPTKVYLKGGLVESFGFSRLNRKTTLTSAEVLFRALLKVVNALFAVLIPLANGVGALVKGIISVIEGLFKALKFIFPGLKTPKFPTIQKVKNPNFASLIDNRIGMASIENEYFQNHKLFLCDVASNPKSNKVSVDNATVINARYIFENYWTGFNRQARIREFDRVEMTLADVINVKNEAAVKLADGKIARVLSCTFNGKLSGGIAKFVVKTFDKYTNNLKKVITE